MKKSNLKSIAQWMIMASFLSLVLTSCGDDEITGCTDPAGVNYNAEATISGNCEYPRDAFLGNYVGDISCVGLVSSIVPDTTVTFSITEHVDPSVLDSVNININDIDILSFPIGAAVDGNKLIITETVRDIPSGSLIGDVDLFISGEATIDDVNMDATLIVRANSSATGGTIVEGDECKLVGVKQ